MNENILPIKGTRFFVRISCCAGGINVNIKSFTRFLSTVYFIYGDIFYEFIKKIVRGRKISKPGYFSEA